METPTTLQRRATSLLRQMRKHEGGFSLAEILIVVAVIGVIGALVAATLIQSSQTSTRYSDATMTQGELLDSISHITRTISLARDITLAGDDYLQMESQEEGKKVITTVFYHDPGVTPDSRFGLGASVQLPNFPAVVEHRKKANGTESLRILVNNYAPSPTQPLFTYFDRLNKQMRTPVDAIELGSIERIAVWLTSTVEGRGTDGEATTLELATSATPRLSIRSSATVAELDPPVTPVLRGTLAPRTQTANLTWSNVAGATSYILFRENSKQNPVKTSINVAAGSFTSTEPNYSDPNRAWGETYTYSVVAVGPGGLSGESNKVALTVVPQQPAFINVIPTDHSTGATSARDLTNRLNWTARNGAQGYRLYRGNTLIYTGTATAYSDTGRAYGDSTQYTVVAYNSGLYGSGGDSFTSSAVTLLSPPVAPTLSSSHTNGTRKLSWNAPAHALKYELNRVSPTATTWSLTARSYDDAQAIDSASFTYRVRAGNDAGFGPWSSNVVLQPRPGTPTVSGQDYVSHPSTRDGNNYISWSNTANAQTYEYRKGSGTATSTTSLNFQDGSPGWASTNTYQVRGCNITGCGSWGSVTLKQPPGPFSISSVSQVKRSGQAPLVAGSQDDFPYVPATAVVNWGGSSGATGYSLRHGASAQHVVTNHNANGRSSGTFAISSGTTYQWTVIATASNGLSRKSATYNFQSSPAQPRSIGTRPQTTNGNTSRTTFWGDPSPKEGTGNGQFQNYVISGATLSNASGWQGWAGNVVASANWSKSSASSSNWVGGMQLQRTYLNIPSGYSAGSVSQQAINAKGTGTDGDYRGHISWTSVIAFRATGAGNWGGGPYSGSTWKDVAYTAGNYPSAGGRDWEQIDAR